MSEFIILLLMFLFVGLLIILLGYITFSYYDFLDRERRTHRVISKSDFPHVIDQRGFEGEENTNRFMESILRPEDYYLRNLIIPVNDYKKVEVDGILISRRGIFCIETKNWKGKLTGFENDDMWYQTKCGKAKQLKNPVLQNEYHSSAVEKVLNFDYEIINCVILYSTLDLRHIVSKHVFNLGSFETFYKSLKKQIISRRELRLVCDKLSLYLASSEDIKIHRENAITKLLGT